MKKSAIAVLAASIVVLSGCLPPVSPGSRNTAGQGKVSVTLSGLAEGSRSGARGIGSDMNVAEVIVMAFNTDGETVGGPSPLTRSGEVFRGTVDVTGTGLIVFQADAMDGDDLALYSGWTAALITGTNDQVSISMLPLTGLVGQWFFDGDAADTSGGGHDGTVTGAVLTEDRFGIPDGAYEFSGSGNIVVPDYEDLHFGTGDFTVSLWMKSTGSTQGMMFEKLNGSDGLCAVVNSSMAPDAIQTGAAMFGFPVIYSPMNPRTNSWHHFVLVRSSGSLQLFLDGGTAFSMGDSTDVTNTSSLYFGSDSTGAQGFSGCVDDVRIYNRALPPDRILALFGEGGWLPASGTLDMTYRDGGNVVPDFGPYPASDCQAVKVQEDGKIVAAGSAGFSDSHSVFVITRINPDGTSDSTFGTDGVVIIDEGFSEAYLYDIALGADGKIVAGGYSSAMGGTYDFTIARLNSDGSRDTGFGDNGLVITDASGAMWNDACNAVAIQSDGKIIAAGNSAYVFDYMNSLAITRFNQDGTIDTTFGQTSYPDADGMLIFPYGYDDAYNSLLIMPDGRIVAGGKVNGGTSTFCLSMFEADGDPDTTFSTDPFVLEDFGDSGLGGGCSELEAAPDGGILAVGYKYAASTENLVLARYDGNGVKVPGFGTGGCVNTNLSGFNEELYAVTVDADGRIVVGGVAGSNHFLARFNPDGGVDPLFGTDGYTITDSLGGDSVCYDLAIDTNGMIVAGGYAKAMMSYYFQLAGYRQ